MVEHGHRVSIAHGRADYVCQPQVLIVTYSEYSEYGEYSAD